MSFSWFCCLLTASRRRWCSCSVRSTSVGPRSPGHRTEPCARQLPACDRRDGRSIRPSARSRAPRPGAPTRSSGAAPPLCGGRLVRRRKGECRCQQRRRRLVVRECDDLGARRRTRARGANAAWRRPDLVASDRPPPWAACSFRSNVHRGAADPLPSSPSNVGSTSCGQPTRAVPMTNPSRIGAPVYHRERFSAASVAAVALVIGLPLLASAATAAIAQTAASAPSAPNRCPPSKWSGESPPAPTADEAEGAKTDLPLASCRSRPRADALHEGGDQFPDLHCTVTASRCGPARRRPSSARSPRAGTHRRPPAFRRGRRHPSLPCGSRPSRGSGSSPR